jgi:hypothetical protein
MGRFGFGTRVAMVVIGAIWCVAGWVWLQLLGPDYFDQRTPGKRIYVLGVMVAIAGLVLIKTGLTPDRPKSFEEEKEDLNPDLTGDTWDDLDD